MTPLEKCPELAKAAGLSAIYFKREDLHPYGSHKGRSIPVMIEKYFKDGDRRFAISSSGNAALAAALYISEMNARKTGKAELDIFVGKKINPAKLEKLRKAAGNDENIRILIKERPLQALTQATEEGSRSLRQSTDDTALIGYASLAEELSSELKSGAVFMGTSSGTTAQALAKYFLDNRRPIQVHIVQTSSCHPLADVFDTFEVPNEQSIADAIVDQTALRKNALTPLIEKTGGRGWCASNQDIETAIELAQEHTGLRISTNSALSLVGAMQAAYVGYELNGPAVCLICGD